MIYATDSETSLYLNVAGPAVQPRRILMVCYLEVNDAMVLVAVNVVFARTPEDLLSCSQRQVSLSKQHPLVKFTKQAGAGAQSPSCKSLVVNGKLSVRNRVAGRPHPLLQERRHPQVLLRRGPPPARRGAETSTTLHPARQKDFCHTPF